MEAPRKRASTSLIRDVLQRERVKEWYSEKRPSVGPRDDIIVMPGTGWCHPILFGSFL